tara:strand:- start:137 stop:427 length:291 start_codon:yes stop_codon:yes gene_type:complete
MSDETLDMLVRGAIAAAITAIREPSEERSRMTLRLLRTVADELGIEVGGSALLQEAQQLLDRKRAEQRVLDAKQASRAKQALWVLSDIDKEIHGEN